VDESNTTDSGSHHDPAYLSDEAAAWFAADEDGSDWDVEIVDELTWTDAVDEGDDVPPAADPFLRLVGAIEQAACSLGAGAKPSASFEACSGSCGWTPRCSIRACEAPS
jgi:hypothetical protein